MRKFEDLQIWQRSHALTLAVYKVSATFPKEELYSLSSQIRRSAASIPTNIAEGCGRNTDADFVRFLVIASGSSSELAYQLILAKDLNYISEEAYFVLNSELAEIRKMINAYIQKVKPSS